MPVPPPWALDIDTIVGVAITLLAVLVLVVVRTAPSATAAPGCSAEPVAAVRSRRVGTPRARRVLKRTGTPRGTGGRGARGGSRA